MLQTRKSELKLQWIFVVRALIDLIRVCYFCGRGVAKGSALCPKCESEITDAAGAQARFQNPLGLQHFYFLNMSGQDTRKWRAMLVDFKEHPHPKLLTAVTRIFIQQMLKLRKKSLNESLLLVPAPSSSGRQHAERFCAEISKQTGLPWCEGFRYSEAAKTWQKLQSKSQRQAPQIEWAGEFFQKDEIIVLVDDILTTGATAKACFEALGRPLGFQVWTMFYRPLIFGA